MSRTKLVSAQLTVFFEEPFWVGVFERNENGKLSAAKVTFGAEPKDGEIFEFILRHYGALQFSPAVAAELKADIRSPKRRQRAAQKQLSDCGVGTKSQQALKMQQEQNKRERQIQSREQKTAAAARRFALKQQKKKISIGADSFYAKA